MRVLIACEFSGIVRDAFANRGHDAWSCDVLPSERDGKHIQDDVRNHFHEFWDLMIAHPPCTYLCNSGVRHLRSDCPDRWINLFEAARFFNQLKNCGIPLVAIENPIPHGYAKDLIGEYSQIIQPWQFGHPETKATCIWTRGLEMLRPTNIVTGREARVHKESPGPDRWKNRSRTLPGIAAAMAEQWGRV